MSTIIIKENMTIRQKKKKQKSRSPYGKRLLNFSRQVDYLRKPSSLMMARYLVISFAFK